MTTYDMRFDLTRANNPDDGSHNPAWIKAAQRFGVVKGDVGHVGSTLVAIHTSTKGALYGRDFLGRSVVLIPATADCDECGQQMDWEDGVGWVCASSGDEGGTYDHCPQSGRTHRVEAR